MEASPYWYIGRPRRLPTTYAIASITEEGAITVLVSTCLIEYIPF